MATGLDKVLISYYETDNNKIRPTLAQWTTLFQSPQVIARTLRSVSAKSVSTIPLGVRRFPKPKAL